MGNRVHVVLEPICSDGLGKLFNLLTIKYSMYFNRKRKRKGRFFDDRFFLRLHDETHFYEAIRYLELNPFKVKTEYDFGEYIWNSSLEHLNLRSQFYLHELPKYFFVDNWLKYLKEGLNLEEVVTKLKSHTMSDFPIGDDQFAKNVSQKLGRNLKKKKQGRPKKVSVLL